MNNLLLSGRPGIGKSTVVRRVAASLGDRRLGGFITDEIREQGGRLGFRLATFEGGDFVLAHIDIRSAQRVGRYGVDVAVLDRVAHTTLAAAAEVWLVDEIGKMECFSKGFVEAMARLLDDERPVVATVALQGGGLIADVKRRRDVELLEVTARNRDAMPERVLAWLGERL